MNMLFKNPALWWRFEGKYYHKNLYRGVKNLIKWFSVVWKDRDWDHTYIYEILRFKLEDQAYGIGSRDLHRGAQREAEKMLLCARLCQIQIDSMYEMEYADYMETTYEFVPTDETNKWYTMETETVEDNLDEYFALYPRQYKRVMNGEVKWYGKITDTTDKKEIAMAIAYENQRRSRELLFKIMEHNIEMWWD